MLIFKGKEITKFKDKKGGKNHSEMDGFYRDPDGVEYFVKKPADPKELFTELFAGSLLQEFKRRGLIAKIYHDSLICAELIQFEDGSYGLIQPKVSFKELYKVIGTAYRDGSDRDPLMEMFYGPQLYLLLTRLNQYFGLAIALMCSLLLGDNSVHSGNVVCLDVISAFEMIFIQFARIDWGAAFRYFGHKRNNEELLNPFEYQGLFNHKGYTKGYFLNYKQIKGLFPAIAEQARILLEQVNAELLVDMIGRVLKDLPVDLLDTKTKAELAKYMCIESFSNISFGKEGDYQSFSHDMTEILFTRLKKITLLKDFPCASVASSVPSVMYVENLPTAITLSVVTPFAEQMNIWLNILSSSDERSIFDFNSIDRAKLVQQFNYFMESLLRQIDRLSQPVNDSHLAPKNGLILPSADNNFLRRQFSLENDLTPSKFSYDESKRSFEHSCWQLVETVLTTSFNAIVTIRIVQDTQNSTELAKASAIHFLFDALKEYLSDFRVVYHVFLNELALTLSSMSGRQLARVCLDEMEFQNSSLLIGMVLKNPVNWASMSKVFDEEYDMFFQEKTHHQIAALRKMYEYVTLFLILISELPLIIKLKTKEVLVKEICRLFELLPDSLQTEYAPAVNEIRYELMQWQRRRSLELEEFRTHKEETNLSQEEKGTNLSAVLSVADQSLQQVIGSEMNNAIRKVIFFKSGAPNSELQSVDEFSMKQEILF